MRRIINILHALELTRQKGNTTGLISLLSKGALVVDTQYHKQTLQRMVYPRLADRVMCLNDLSASNFMGSTHRNLPLFFDNSLIFSVLYFARGEISTSLNTVRKQKELINQGIREQQILRSQLKEMSIELTRTTTELMDNQNLSDSREHCIDNLQSKIDDLTREVSQLKRLLAI